MTKDEKIRLLTRCLKIYASNENWEEESYRNHYGDYRSHFVAEGKIYNGPELAKKYLKKIKTKKLKVNE